jgi:hypothetical protein
LIPLRQAWFAAAQRAILGRHIFAGKHESKLDSSAASLICGKTMLHIVPDSFADRNMKRSCRLKMGYCSGVSIRPDGHKKCPRQPFAAPGRLNAALVRPVDFEARGSQQRG